ncbi:hypothetical protein AC72_1197 [Escherichia coli 2-316-03_S4_C1]|nr:hypothetical protein AC72_1197 [Escherichia coli 2-316-03_S4_C1]
MLCRTVIGIPLELFFEVQYTNPRLLDVSSSLQYNFIFALVGVVDVGL